MPIIYTDQNLMTESGHTHNDASAILTITDTK